MTKVVRIVINHQYTPIKPDMLVKGEIVPFDIFIKRYNNFVIIIESGTLLDEGLLEKLSLHPEIYISKSDSSTFKTYSSFNHTINLDEERDPLLAALTLKEKSSLITDMEERLFFVYSTVSDLMEFIFESGNEKLPIDALTSCVNEMVDLFQTKENALPRILKIIPHEYSTHNHSTNVAYFAAIIGNMMKMKNQELFDLIFAALMHDIGKLRIDETILGKRTSLEEDEFESVKLHSQLGREILKQNGIDNETILKGVKHHHERLDGSGYPDGLRGKIIPRNARIIGVCDVFDALTTNRTFRDNYSSFEALQLMKYEMYKQFDETFVDIFIQLHR